MGRLINVIAMIGGCVCRIVLTTSPILGQGLLRCPKPAAGLKPKVTMPQQMSKARDIALPCEPCEQERGKTCSPLGKVINEDYSRTLSSFMAKRCFCLRDDWPRFGFSFTDSGSLVCCLVAGSSSIPINSNPLPAQQPRFRSLLLTATSPRNIRACGFTLRPCV